MLLQKYTYRFDENRMKGDLLSQGDLDRMDSIALHHMDHLTAGIDDVTGWHMDENLWDWNGYGFWVGLDGTKWEVRGLKYLNAAVKNNNNHIISIGFQGDHNKMIMPDEQFKSGVEIIQYIKSKLPNIRTIAGHKYWNDTSCPGKNFPVVNMVKKSLEVVQVPEQKIDEEFKTNLEILKSYNQITSPDYWLDHCVEGGKIDGLYAKEIINKFAEFFKNRPM